MFLIHLFCKSILRVHLLRLGRNSPALPRILFARLQLKHWRVRKKPHTSFGTMMNNSERRTSNILDLPFGALLRRIHPGPPLFCRGELKQHLLSRLSRGGIFGRAGLVCSNEWVCVYPVRARGEIARPVEPTSLAARTTAGGAGCSGLLPEKSAAPSLLTRHSGMHATLGAAASSRARSSCRPTRNSEGRSRPRFSPRYGSGLPGGRA